MAESHLTSAERVRIYRSLYRLNRLFHFVAVSLHDLDGIRIFNPERLRELRGLAKELQTEINYYFVENLEGIESADWFHFGKVRIARDHRLNPDRPAFGQRK
jgi:hypothetical protein